MTVVPYERAWIALQSPAVELANAIAATDFVPKALRGNPAAITAAILYGDEVGLGPMQSLAKIAVIDGRPTLAAEAQRALILSAGHDLWIEEATATRCTVAGRRKGSENTSRVTWTMDDARKAGISDRRNWRTYPRQMLLARASAELARVVFADAIGGLAATEEIEDPDGTADGGVAAPLPSPAPPGRRVRRAASTLPTTTAAVDQVADHERPPLPGEETTAADVAASVAVEGVPDALVVPPAAAEGEPSGAPEPELLTDPQRRRLMALFRDRGFTSRDHRLAYSRRIIGRPIESSNELTVGEASVLILALEAQALESE